MADDSGAGGSRRSSFLTAALTTYGTNVTVAGVSLVNVLVVSRVLGPSGRGGVAFMTTIAYFTSQIATLGVQQANSNLCGRDARLRPGLATNSIVLALLLGGSGIGVLALLVALFPQLDGRLSGGLLALSLLAIPFLVLQTYFQALLQADYRFSITNSAWLVPPFANIAVNVALAGAGLLSVRNAVATWVGGQILATLIMGWYVARRWAGFGRPDPALGRTMVSFGLKTHAGRMMLMGNYRLDQWLLGALAGTAQLGLYSVAVAWAEALFYLPTALAYVQRPDLVRASSADAGRRAAAVFRVATLVTVALAVGMVVLAPYLCGTIFGGSFAGSAQMLRILAPGALGIVALKQLGGALIAQSKPLLESLAIGAAFVGMVGLDVALIPAHGGLGAAVASTIAYLIGGVAVAAIFVRTLGTPLRALVPTRREPLLLARLLRPPAAAAPAGHPVAEAHLPGETGA